MNIETNNPIIPFCHNWNNKLLCNVWSTLRLRNDVKYQLNKAYDIELDGKFYGDCICVFIKHFDFLAITEPLFLMDMGYNLENGRKLLKNLYAHKPIEVEQSQFSYMLFKWKPKYQDISQLNAEPIIQQVLKAS